jgi:ubiquitin-like domain-containing CTD phosphatase 1
MFTVVSTKRDGTKVKHHVKPLQIIWSKFPDRWGTHNTVHIDDLSRNFALNLDNGLQCTAYHRKKKKSSSASSSSITPSNHGHHDRELVGLSQYLIQLIESGMTFHQVDFTQWTDVVTGKTIIATKKKPKK